MALPKLFNLITWHNNTTPAINEDNLNAMSEAIDNIDDRVIGLAGTITEDVAQIQEDIEEIEGYMDVIDDKVDAATTAANNANTSKNAAASQALVSEGYAKGTQNGTPVGSTSPYYHNNAEYFMEEARTFTPEGYQDLVEEVSDLNTEVNSVKETLTNNINLNGCKNILPMPYYQTKGGAITSNGLTVKENQDGSITVNGTATSATYVDLVFKSTFLKAGDYILSGGISAKQFLFINVYNNGSIIRTIVRSEVSENAFTIDYNGYDSFTVGLGIASGESLNNVTFYPMIRLATDTDSTWQPPTKTNRQLTQDSVSWDSEAQIGAVNYFDHTGTSYAASNGVVFTVNSDRTITVTVPSSHAGDLMHQIYTGSKYYDMCGGVMRLQSGVSEVVSANGKYKFSGNPIPNYGRLNIEADKAYIYINENCPAGTYVFKPMLTPVSYNGPYVPYAKTNRELTEVKTTSVTAKGVTLDIVKSGNVCVSRFSGSLSENVALDTTILTIPNGYKPISQVTFLTTNRLASLSNYVAINYADNGNVQPSGTGVATGDALRGSACWITAS